MVRLSLSSTQCPTDAIVHVTDAQAICLVKPFWGLCLGPLPWLFHGSWPQGVCRCWPWRVGSQPVCWAWPRWLLEFCWLRRLRCLSRLFWLLRLPQVQVLLLRMQVCLALLPWWCCSTWRQLGQAWVHFLPCWRQQLSAWASSLHLCWGWRWWRPIQGQRMWTESMQ